ncbi:MAG TPA: inositol oxygenase family protein [Bryobacteraceae bacterium]|nr:inositol oxygenase family protein [Bryobacteraceae bacterium]
MQGPLTSLDQWDDFVQVRYDPNRRQDHFRQHTTEAPAVVREFYRLNHTHQTLDFVRRKKREYSALQKRRMGIWEAMEYLNTLVDDSDPDTDLSQIEHLLQTAEAIRRDGRPRWFILTGLIHDLGKILCLFGEPQWAVVGDTFPVGCAWSKTIVYPDYFAANPDAQVPEYQTRLGVYREGCGLDQVDLSWGHDEYLYQVMKGYLPLEGLYMIRYHSFYPWHQEGAYSYFLNDQDRRMLEWVRAFNPYDLYSKSAERPDLEKIKPFYQDLIAEYFPPLLNW